MKLHNTVYVLISFTIFFDFVTIDHFFTEICDATKGG